MGWTQCFDSAAAAAAPTEAEMVEEWRTFEGALQDGVWLWNDEKENAISATEEGCCGHR